MFSNDALAGLQVDLPRPNYSNMTNEELIDALFDRKLERPVDDNNKLIRKQAVALLKQWDEEHPGLYRKDPMVRVIFTRSGATAAPYVFIGLNGKMYQVPYDKEVTLPLSVVRVTDECVQERYVVTRDNANNPVTEVIRERRYPYTMLGVAN